MNQPPQQPHQPPPGWGQQPPQPGWGPPQPQPPKKNTGKIIGLGCLGVLGLIMVIGIIGALLSGTDDSGNNASDKVDTSQEEPAKDSKDEKPKEEKPKEPETDTEAADEAVFKVWGDAPSGVDITYGSDSENLEGSALPMTKKLEVNSDALYYHINAQLMGSGDIQCSVTIGDETKTGRAKGGYNICSAQLNGLSGGWQ